MIDAAGILDSLIDEQALQSDLDWAMSEIDRLESENARLNGMLDDAIKASLRLNIHIKRLQRQLNQEDECYDRVPEGLE